LREPLGPNELDEGIERNMSIQGVVEIQLQLARYFVAINEAMTAIRLTLDQHADGKNLKGDEAVGWLGEVYGKTFMDGQLVADDLDYDFITSDGKRVSVKARKGSKRQWNRSGAIPRIDGDDSPTHLMFVHLDDDYTLRTIYLYVWDDLVHAGRFRKHIVRNVFRSYYLLVNPGTDSQCIVYDRPGNGT
jgi:hypothetical protein